jgi:alpha-galactosidase
MQEGFSSAYTPAVMMAWVTDVPNGIDNRTESPPYRFLSAMQGGLGIGTNLNKWTPEDFATAKTMIPAYKRVRETVQHGSLYRLVSALDNNPYSATESVSDDRRQAVLFAFLHSSQDGYLYPRLFLQGLDPAATYNIRSIYGKLSLDTLDAASGDYWMHHGVDVMLRGDFQAAAFVFEQR